MKKILMFYLPSCPHCKNAFTMVEELRQEYPELAALKIETVDEKAQPELADKFDYYLVPTYYVDGVKLHEGIPDKDKLKAVLFAAL